MRSTNAPVVLPGPIAPAARPRRATAPRAGRPRRTKRWLAWDSSEPADSGLAVIVPAVALASMVLISVILVSLAAAHPSLLSPTARTDGNPRWLAGPLGPLTSWIAPSAGALNVVFTASLATMYVAYVVVLTFAPRMHPGWAIAAVVVLQLIYFVSPPLPLTDVFNYLNYGRMEVVHHLNPYTTIPALEPHDDATFALSNWHGLLSPYGPLFTLFTLAIVWLGVAGSFWVLKTTLLIASLASVWVLWSAAGLLGRNRLAAALLIGLNPIVLVWGLGADHNDFLMVFLVTLALYLLLRARVPQDSDTGAERAPVDPAARRAKLGRAVSWPRAPRLTLARSTAGRAFAAADAAPRRVAALVDESPWREFTAGVALAGAVAIKASAAILIPIVLAGSVRRLRLSAGLLAGFAGFGAATLVAFGANLPNLGQQDSLVTAVGIPNLAGYIIGVGGDTSGVRLLFTLVVVLAVALCAFWAWRTHDWLMPCACATLALLVSLSWTLPWYLIWLLPFAALTRARWIRVAAILLGVYMFMSSMPYASSIERHTGFNPRTTNIGRADEDYLHSLLY